MATGAVSASAEYRVPAGSNFDFVLFVIIERRERKAAHCESFSSGDEPATRRR
ncbi:MAG: hypothetical protein IPI40_15925 [Betaproteobacteria bacterium]|nr:hypothetical protein [Betaproteobacteria bacterium]